MGLRPPGLARKIARPASTYGGPERRETAPGEIALEPIEASCDGHDMEVRLRGPSSWSPSSGLRDLFRPATARFARRPAVTAGESFGDHLRRPSAGRHPSDR